MPAEGQASGAWPSPRSWELCTRALAGAEVHGLDTEARDAFCASFVGSAAWAEAAHWIAAADLPDPEAVLDGRVQWAPDLHRLDRTAATLGACAALVAPRDAPRRSERATRLWGMLAATVAVAADVARPAAQVLVVAGLHTTVASAARPVLAAIHGLHVAAGVV